MYVFDESCVIDQPWLTKLVEKYLTDNSSRSLDNKFHLTSNGRGYKKICNGLARFYLNFAVEISAFLSPSFRRTFP